MEITAIIGIAAMGLGMLIALIGWIWLIITGFKAGGALWGILNIFFQPITGIIFCVLYKTGWIPLVLMIVGNIIAFGGMLPFVPKYIEALENIPK